MESASLKEEAIPLEFTSSELAINWIRLRFYFTESSRAYDGFSKEEIRNHFLLEIWNLSRHPEIKDIYVDSFLSTSPRIIVTFRPTVARWRGQRYDLGDYKLYLHVGISIPFFQIICIRSGRTDGDIIHPYTIGGDKTNICFDSAKEYLEMTMREGEFAVTILEIARRLKHVNDADADKIMPYKFAYETGR